MEPHDFFSEIKKLQNKTDKEILALVKPIQPDVDKFMSLSQYSLQLLINPKPLYRSVYLYLNSRDRSQYSNFLSWTLSDRQDVTRYANIKEIRLLPIKLPSLYIPFANTVNILISELSQQSYVGYDSRYHFICTAKKIIQNGSEYYELDPYNYNKGRFVFNNTINLLENITLPIDISRYFISVSSIVNGSGVNTLSFTHSNIAIGNTIKILSVNNQLSYPSLFTTALLTTHVMQNGYININTVGVIGPVICLIENLDLNIIVGFEVIMINDQ